MEDSIWLPAKVPGSVQFNLENLELLPNKNLGNNHGKVGWVEDLEWEYQTDFEIQHPHKQEKFTLVFEGLDTYARIYLNGDLLFFADNMFVTHRIDITQKIQSANTLRVVFVPPAKHHKDNYWMRTAQLPHAYERVSPLSRKAAFHFGWDWGPRMATMGIWKPVSIVRSRSVHIQEGSLQGLCDADGRTQIHYRIQLSGQPSEEISAVAVVNDSITWDIKLTTALSEGTLDVESLNKWSPTGFGQPSLHKVVWRLVEQNTILDSLVRHIGFRHLHLDTSRDSIGSNFQFFVNHLPIFCKGANYIPLSHYLSQTSRADYRKLLVDLVSAHMNTVRVWGGGIYESEDFYELCDSLGILVWQDFMFANTMYPPELNESIRKEVRQNVQNLAHHPSIIHWCGNNEVDVAWHNWGWQKQFGIHPSDSALLADNYREVFQNIIPDILKSGIPGSTYSHTTPLSNWGLAENYNHRTMHDWSVYHGDKPFTQYGRNIGRFVTEFGFQSYPSRGSTDAILAHGDTLRAWEERQKSYKGNGPINQQVQTYFGTEWKSKHLGYASQICQSIGVGYGIQNHRIHQDRCHGSLYWQLNDVWPAVSWSSIDHSGDWKALHYEVKRKFREPGVFIDTTDGQFHLVLVNSSHRPLEQSITHGTDPLNWKKKTLVIPPFSTHTLLLNPQDRNTPFYYVHSHSAVDTLSFVHKHLPFHHLPLQFPNLEVKTKWSNGACAIHLVSESPVLGVFLESKVGGIWSDNYFDLLPGIPKTVWFHPSEKKEEDIHLQVNSINHILHGR